MDRFQNTRQPDWDWWGKLWPAPGETLRALGLSPGRSVVEIGSGNGYFALPAARIVAPAPVYGVDLDPAMLDELARLADQQELGNVHPVRGDARTLPDLLPGPVDVALIANTFHGVQSPGAFVRAAFDAVAPGGEFVVVNWHDRPRERTPVAGKPRGPPTELRLAPAETRRRVLDGADWTVVERVDLPPYHYALRFQRPA